MKARYWTLLAGAGVATALFAFAGCGGDDAGTNPPPGGGTTFNSGGIAAGGQFVFTFPTAGSFRYLCTIHPSMRDTIFVATGGSDSVLIEIRDMTANGFVLVEGGPTVKPGGYVHWRNVDNVAHTVTSN